MASKTAPVASLCLALFLNLSAQAEDNNQAEQTDQKSLTVSEEIIVVAPKTQDENAFHLALQPGIADPQDSILQNLAERLNGAAGAKRQLDI
ncbi:MAG: hypothetical protein NXH95_03475 [Pseudomonadaceae bacterium]|nr:hypothetical protein [Pseudomonadaceae bacterium]